MHETTLNAPTGLPAGDEEKLRAIRERARTAAALRKAQERLEEQREKAEALRRAGRNPTPWDELPVWRKLWTVAGLGLALGSLVYGVVFDYFENSAFIAVFALILASIGRYSGEPMNRCCCSDDDPEGRFIDNSSEDDDILTNPAYSYLPGNIWADIDD